MKRFFALLLVLVLLLSASALADGVVGCWAHYELLTTGCPSMTMLYLAEDHTCYYLIQSYDHDEPGIGRTFVGTWEMQADGTVLAKTGNNSDTVLYFSPEYQVAMNTKTFGLFINLSVFDSFGY